MYVLEDTSPSSVGKKLDIPLSSVDRVTNTLKTSGALIKTDEGGRENIYTVNWNLWIREACMSAGFDIEEAQLERIEKIIKDQESVILWVLLREANSKIMREIIPSGDTQGEFVLALLSKINPPSLIHYPYLEISLVQYSQIQNVFFNFKDRMVKGKPNKEEEDKFKKKLLGILNNVLKDNKILSLYMNKVDDEIITRWNKRKDELSEIIMEIVKSDKKEK